jgi:hypothetical protein
MRGRRGNRAKSSPAAATKHGRSRRLGFATLVASIACTSLAATAQASTVTVGSVLPPTFTPSTFGQVETFFNTALPEKGANLVSPVSGAIVRWRVQGASGGPYFLRVLHPTGSGAYTAAGTSGAASPSGTGLQTFAANLPIEAGDLIGIDPTHPTDGIGIASVPGASYAFIFPPPYDESTVAPSGSGSGQEIELNAEVQPAPTITSVLPDFGSVGGGTKVTITGTNFTAASEVKFGSKPASSFTVESDTKITAISPPSSVRGEVDVSATTLAGTSTSVRADTFTYTACVVPNLKGKKLTPAKRALRRAECKLGTVKGPTGRSARVSKQTPKPGAILAPESKVNLKLVR